MPKKPKTCVTVLWPRTGMCGADVKFIATTECPNGHIAIEAVCMKHSTMSTRGEMVCAPCESHGVKSYNQLLSLDVV